METRITGATLRIDRESAEIVDEYMKTEEVNHLDKAVSDIIKKWHNYMKEYLLN